MAIDRKLFAENAPKAGFKRLENQSSLFLVVVMTVVLQDSKLDEQRKNHSFHSLETQNENLSQHVL